MSDHPDSRLTQPPERSLAPVALPPANNEAEQPHRPRFLTRPLHIVVLIITILGAAVTGVRSWLYAGQSTPTASVRPSPPEVAVVQVEQTDVPIYQEWVGTLDGSVNAQIKPQVSGYLLHQAYTEGSFVKRGQLLFEIDPRSFQAALDQTKGQLAAAEAQLAQTEANQVTARIDVERYGPLAKEHAVSQQDLDHAVQADLAAQAQVRAARAQIEAAKAQMATAQLNLGFTRIVSLIDGIAGIAQAQIGDLVGPASLLTTVSTLDPIKVYFPVSAQEYLTYVAHPAAHERLRALELFLVDGTRSPRKGTFSLADREVDVTTGTLRLEGLFRNPGNVLRPGQFARVRAITTTKKGALLVPQRAVTELQGSYQVGVVDKESTVEIRPVKVGERIGAQWIVEEGLTPGERVVADGIQRVRGGMTVKPTTFKAASEATPAATTGSETR